ncbi:MAG: DUF3488 domain-containing transglutaminase family protein [Deltaproteobacteria bacterium]|nr:DUF3488 domain-containing transglutaminase family protein [Deltaproteobacteria bacterium]
MRKFKMLNIASLLVYPALLGSVSSVIYEVHPVYLAVFILSFSAGLFFDTKSNNIPAIKPLILLILLIISIIISLIGISDKNIFNRALGILLLLISARLVSPKKARDILQLYLLNFFAVAASVVIRLDIEFGILVLGETFISILGLMLLYGASEQEETGSAHILKLVRLSGLLTIALIPVTVVIFLIIPRPSMTLFAWGGGVTSATGFSDRVSPGEVEEIKSDSSPAFRVKWLKGTRPSEIFWRGIVYDSYDQGSWKRIYTDRINPHSMSSESIEYEMIMEPTGTKYLFTTGIPFRTSLSPRAASIVTGYTLESLRNIEKRIIYKVSSHTPSAIPPDISPSLYLGIPEQLSGKLAPLADRLARKTVMETADSVKAMLKENYIYDLSPGEPLGDPVIHFLTRSRKGHCEYFASAMTLLLRSMGIPARIVGGYLSGEWNGLGQYYLVRQTDAHTWVEVWIRDHGWVPFDPTPPGIFTTAESFSKKVYRFIDFLRLKWYYWVIDYNIGRQLDLARNTTALLMSLKSKNLRVDISGKIPNMRRLIIFSSGVIILIGFVYGGHRLKKRPRSWAEKFVFLMQKNGFKRKPGQTLLELAKSITTMDYGIAKTAIAFVEKYHQFEYGKAGDKELEIIFKKLKNNFSRKISSPLEAHIC